MKNLLEEIRDDILDDVPLSAILRKTLYLAYELDNAELREWVERELNGYRERDSVPEYRWFAGVPRGSYVTINAKVSGADVPLSLLPVEFRNVVEFHYGPGVPQIEAIIEEEKS